MKKLAAFLLILTVGVLPMMAQNMQFTKYFDAAKMKERVVKLSGDEFAGRGPGTKEGKASAQWIADQLKAIGVQPGNKGSYFQNVKLAQLKVDHATTLQATSSYTGTDNFIFGKDFVAFTGAQKADVNVDADLIFAGYGISSDLYKWNDYKGDPNRYKGKVLMILVNDPPATAAEPDLFTGKALTYNGRWMYKYEEAARRGAAGVLLVHTTESAGYGWNVVETSNGGTRYDIAREPGDTTPYLDIKAWVQQNTAQRILDISRDDLKLKDLMKKAESRDFTPIDTGVRIRANLKAEVSVQDSPNVVGMIPGSDAKLKSEYLVYSAHWDHLGVGKPNDKGDAIYNGALDNASGCTAILSIADAMMQLEKKDKPRRSAFFLFPTAEEQGLLGAEYFAHHPLVPLNKIAGNVNIDGLNIFGKTTDFVALGAERSDLWDAVTSVAQERSMDVSGDPHPEQGSFYRSDHFPFAKVGVPSLSLKEGHKFIGKPDDYGDKVFDEFNTKNYHQPSDEYGDWWNLDSMVQECEIGLAIGLRIADLTTMPRFKKTDEFAAPDKIRMGGK